MKGRILCLFVLVALFSATASMAQGTLGKGGTQLNLGVGFSNFGVPVYGGLDFGVHQDITIGPRVSWRSYHRTFQTYKYNQNLIVISFNGNYHFNTLLEIADPWDFYAGLSLGYYAWSSTTASYPSQSSGIGLTAQIGGRYFLSDKVGLNLEFGGGTVSGGGFGVTIKF